MRSATAIFLTAAMFASPAFAGVLIRSGVIEKVDPEGRTVVLSIQGKSESFILPAELKIVLNGKAGEFSDLEEDMKVSITFDSNTRKVTRFSATQAEPKEKPDDPKADENVAPAEFEVITAEWRESYQHSYTQLGAGLSSSTITVKVEPTQKNERLLVATVRCKWLRKLTTAEVKLTKKTAKKSDLTNIFKADVILSPGSWTIGTYDAPSKALALRVCGYSRLLEGSANTLTVQPSDKSKVPFTTIFLSKPSNKASKDPVMELVGIHSRNDDSPLIVIFPRPLEALRPVAFRLKFSDSGKFESAERMEEISDLTSQAPADPSDQKK